MTELAPLLTGTVLDGPLERADAERIAGILKALSSPTRLRMLSLLASNSDGVSTMDFVDPTGVAQPTVTHHLLILREAGLVETVRSGVYGINTLNAARFTELAQVLKLVAGNNPRSSRRR